VTDREDSFRLLINRGGAPLLGDVYVVLDLSGPAASAVRSIRTRYSYDYLGAMPVEITVAGSGGVGSPAEREDPRPFFAALDEIVESTAPIHGRLNTTRRFPETDVFFVQPEDPDPIVALHERIATCGIKFDPAQFPFVPHCTLTQPPNPTPTDANAPELQVDAEFTADTLSVYQIEAFPVCTLRYRGYLQSFS
jgi:2'-5' RNA ligase